MNKVFDERHIGGVSLYMIENQIEKKSSAEYDREYVYRVRPLAEAD